MACPCTCELTAAVTERTRSVHDQASPKSRMGEGGIAKAKFSPSLKNCWLLMSPGGESLLSLGVVPDRLPMSQWMALHNTCTGSTGLIL